MMQDQEREQVQARLLRKADDRKKKGVAYKLDPNNPKKEPEKEVQAKQHVNRHESAASQQSQAAPASFESSLQASKGGGTPLAGATRSFMESRFGADFSGVRIHTGGDAVKMSDQISAYAFTHGNDIYFNQSAYRPDSSQGRQLLAHELTHTVQQGAAAQRASARSKIRHTTAGASNRAIHRSWLGDAWNAVSDTVSSAVEAVGDALSEGIDLIKDQFVDFVRAIPGYDLLSVVLGQDPIGGDPVARNGRNFIEAGLDIIPFGNLLKRKLIETGAMEQAATWLDERIAGLDISLSSISGELSDFWDSLSLSDIGNPSGVISRAATIIRRPIAQIVTFAGEVATEFLRIIKEIVLSEVSEFVQNNTRGFPLLCVILGKNPITDEVVERNGMNLIRGFVLLSPNGEQELRQMQESGALQRAAEWIDNSIESLGLAWEGIKNAFSETWSLITIENLMQPIETFNRIVSLFAEPVTRVVSFVIEVSLMILKFIKDALLSRLSSFARNTRGYPLLTVLLGKDPFTEEPVERNAENIIHGFMSLMEGGEEQFQQMKQTGAVQRMTERIEGAVARLNLTWEFIKGLFLRAWESFSLQDLAAPLEAFGRILALFAEPVRRLFNFIVEVVKMAVEVILIIMRFPINLINNIISKAMQAIQDIKRDPIGFFKNILKAIKQGFRQFFDNIATHLLNGVTGWLFGQLEDAGITPPPDLSLSSILGLVMQILGITVDRIWQKLGEKIGQERVARIRGMIDRLTGIWSFVRDVMTRGPVAIWEYVVEKLSNLWDLVLEQIRNWIVTRIIQAVTTKLLSMLDPTGIMAVVNSVIALYRAIESFIQYLREMLEIVNSFVEGVAQIARGDVSRAANFLENALARGLPIAIGFLANQVGLGGLGRRISEMIEVVREKVDAALDWLIDKAVRLGSGVLNAVRSGVSGAVGRIRNWWSARKGFRTPDGRQHSVYFQGSGTGAHLMIASDPTPYQDFLNSVDVAPDKQADKQQAIEIAGQLDTAIRNASQSGSSPSGQGASGSGPGAQDHATNIQSLMDQLGTITARFMPVGSTQESTPPVYGGRVNGFGSSATVLRLSAQHEDGGSPTIHSNPFWQALRRRMDGGGTYYVRGHLLNDNLGGPGNTWDNLTPLTQGANNRDGDSHLHGFETPVKNAVEDGKIVNFVVHANYGRASRAGDATYFRDQGNPDDDVRADIVEAEEKIPTTLDCRAGEVNPDGSPGSAIKNHRVDNSIDTNRNNYSLSPTPTQTVYLNEMSKAELLSLNGIGDRLADGIIDNRPFRTKAEIQEKVHIAGGRWAQMQSTSGKSVRIYRA
ncbi:MAG: DUF4157 domain-containing protein [Chitinivibrionales bacterium]|nr:DUF4157 domain-containing protein [Chitinivibrionales bacterium]